MFKALEKKFPSVFNLSIMYSFYIVGSPEYTIEVCKYLEDLCITDVSLTLNRSKCKILHFMDGKSFYLQRSLKH